jgi:hypothetical protein
MWQKQYFLKKSARLTDVAKTILFILSKQMWQKQYFLKKSASVTDIAKTYTLIL